MIRNFEDLIKEIDNGKNFEDIFSNDYPMVECCGNEIFLDTDFEDFLNDMNVDYTLFQNGFCKIDKYVFPYKEIENRFDKECGNEIIICLFSHT